MNIGMMHLLEYTLMYIVRYPSLLVSKILHNIADIYAW